MQKFLQKNIQRGFTLVEMMLVIAILAILFVIISQVNFSARINQERATNFANYIADMIRDTRHNAMVGRMAKTATSLLSANQNNQIITDGRFIEFAVTEYPQSIDAVVDDGDTNDEPYISIGSIQENSHDGVYEEKKFRKSLGFLDGDRNYLLNSIFVSDQGFHENVRALENGNLNTIGYLKIKCKEEGCKSYGVDGNIKNDIRTFKIEVEYKGFKRYVYGDMISGAIYVLNTESK